MKKGKKRRHYDFRKLEVKRTGGWSLKIDDDCMKEETIEDEKKNLLYTTLHMHNIARNEHREGRRREASTVERHFIYTFFPCLASSSLF